MKTESAYQHFVHPIDQCDVSLKIRLAVDILPSTGESGGVSEVSQKVDRRSSSVSRVEMILVGSDEDVRPMQTLCPNIAEYGEHFIP
jgi:hypothetical protein